MHGLWSNRSLKIIWLTDCMFPLAFCCERQEMALQWVKVDLGFWPYCAMGGSHYILFLGGYKMKIFCYLALFAYNLSFLPDPWRTLNCVFETSSCGFHRAGDLCLLLLALAPYPLLHIVHPNIYQFRKCLVFGSIKLKSSLNFLSNLLMSSYSPFQSFSCVFAPQLLSMQWPGIVEQQHLRDSQL